MNETNIINVPGSNNSKENNMNECYQIQSLILSNNQSLSSIFEFKTDTIHTLSVTLKAFDIIMLFCLIFMFLSFPFPHKKDDTNCLGSFCLSLCDEICSRSSRRARKKPFAKRRSASFFCPFGGHR